MVAAAKSWGESLGIQNLVVIVERREVTAALFARVLEPVAFANPLVSFLG